MVDNNIERNINHVKNLSYILIGNGQQRYSGTDVADFDTIKDLTGVIVLLTDGTLHYHYNTSFTIGYKNQTSVIPNEK